MLTLFILCPFVKGAERVKSNSYKPLSSGANFLPSTPSMPALTTTREHTPAPTTHMSLLSPGPSHLLGPLVQLSSPPTPRIGSDQFLVLPAPASGRPSLMTFLLKKNFFLIFIYLSGWAGS